MSIVTLRLHWKLLVISVIWVHANTNLFAQISNEGLLIEYRYETSGGSPVSDGASATGQVDDTGLAPAIHAIGSGGGGGMIGLHYDSDVPGGINSSFSLNFPAPENPLNFVAIPMTFGDELSSITEGDFRVEAWFRTTDIDRSNLVSSFTGPANALNLELHTANRGRIYVQGPGGVSDLNVTLPTDSRDGQWHHLAGVRDGDVVELYYDGELVGSMFDVAGGYTIDKTDFYLGMDGRASGTPRFQGGLDDVRIYNSSDTSSLVAEYLFETIEGSPVTAGMLANDQIDDTAIIGPFHGFGSAAGSVTTPKYVADVPSVLTSSKHAFSVDEQSSAVEDARIVVTPELAELTMGDFAIETWFKTTDTGRSILLGGFAGGTDTVNLELHTDNRVRIYIDGPSVTDLNVTAPIETRNDEWHHLVGQREGDLVSLFLNGELVDQTLDLAGPFEMQVGEMFLTRDSRTGATQFDGKLDNTRFWSRALTEDEILALALGATVQGSVSGDFDGDGTLTAADIDRLTAAIRSQLFDPQFDLDSDGSLGSGDLNTMIVDLVGTWFGDADLNGEFSSGDFVNVFQRGQYEDGIAGNSGWADGDWNGDAEFNTSDFVSAFQGGGFEQGPRAQVAAVPEPSSWLLLSFSVFGLLRRRR
jgi:hypothetical protein